MLMVKVDLGWLQLAIARETRLATAVKVVTPVQDDVITCLPHLSAAATPVLKQFSFSAVLDALMSLICAHASLQFTKRSWLQIAVARSIDAIDTWKLVSVACNYNEKHPRLPPP
jgi:hypothetical protein